MKKTMWFIVWLIFSAHMVWGEEPDAIELCKRILQRENARLREAVEATKGFMAMARLTADHAQKCEHAIDRMAATIAMYDLILKHGRQDLLVVTSQGVVDGDLERYYADQKEKRKTPERVTKEDLEQARKLEQSLLAELKILKEWRDKGINHDICLGSPGVGAPERQPVAKAPPNDGGVLDAVIAEEIEARKAALKQLRDGMEIAADMAQEGLGRAAAYDSLLTQEIEYLTALKAEALARTKQAYGRMVLGQRISIMTFQVTYKTAFGDKCEAFPRTRGRDLLASEIASGRKKLAETIEMKKQVEDIKSPLVNASFSQSRAIALADSFLLERKLDWRKPVKATPLRSDRVVCDTDGPVAFYKLEYETPEEEVHLLGTRELVVTRDGRVEMLMRE